MAALPRLQATGGSNLLYLARNLASTSRLRQDADAGILAGAENRRKPAAGPSKSSYSGRYQDLHSFDPILDVDLLNSVVLPRSAKKKDISRRDPLAVIHRNRKPLFRVSAPPLSAMHGKQEMDALAPLKHVFPDLKAADFGEFHRHVLHQRKFHIYRKHLGKVSIVNVVACVGNGNGMLGLGIAYATDTVKARDLAYQQAVKNMTPVNRCEGRTIWSPRTDKLSATVIQMWPRPPGFGISTHSTVMNRMCKSAGIKDITVRLRRSRNRYFVAQLLWRMLKAEAQPIGYGNGLGRKGDRLEKGMGMMSNEDVARSLGRRAHWHT